MLVLTRKTEQKIRIGNNIVITVLKVQGEQVSIGIDAPKDLQIVREELLSSDQYKAAAENNKKYLIKDAKPYKDLEDLAENFRQETKEV